MALLIEAFWLRLKGAQVAFQSQTRELRYLAVKTAAGVHASTVLTLRDLL
jgi:hypothetical protein